MHMARKRTWALLHKKYKNRHLISRCRYLTAGLVKTLLYLQQGDHGKQMGFRYSKFVPILVKAVQELSTALDCST